ncbi:unnamed protein product [Closterium sp. NIES-54]
MASLRVLAFDHEGRPVQFDTWLDDLQLYLLSDSKDIVSLFDLVSGAAPAPPTTADSATRSKWLTRDAAARLAIRNHLPLAECAHFVRCCCCPLLLACHCCSRPPASALPVPRAVSLCHSRGPVTRLPDSLCSVKDHFLSLDPTSLTVDLLEQHLLAAETSAVAVGAAHGTPSLPFFEGYSPSPLAPSYASAAAAGVSVAEDVGAASASAKHRSSKGKGGRGGGGGSGSRGGGSSGGSRGRGGGVVVELVVGVGALVAAVEAAVGVAAVEAVGLEVVGLDLGMEALVVASDSSSSVAARPSRPSSSTCGKLQTQHCCFSRLDDAWRAEFGDDVELPRWADLLRSRIAILDLEFDAILSDMYALSISAEGDCYRCVPPDPRIAAATLGASESGTLPAPLSLLYLHLSRTAALQDAMVTTTTPGGQRVSICTCTRTWRHLATFTCQPGSTLYTLATQPPQVAASAEVSTSGQVAASCSCRLLSNQTLLWHHRLGHPSLPHLRGMHSRLVVSGLPRSLPPLPPSPAPPCLPCVEGRQRAAPHSTSFPSTTDSLQTLHMDVWGPAGVSGQSRERNFLLVVDDYTRYTTVFPLGSKGQVVDVLIPWIRTVRLQLRERFGQDLRVLRLHSDRGGVSQVDPLARPAPVEVAIVSGAARGAASGGAASGGAVSGVAESEGAGSRGAEPGGEEPEGAEPAGVEPQGVEPGGAEFEGAKSGGAKPRAGGARVTAGHGGARTRGTSAAGTGGFEGAGAGDPTEPGATRAGGAGAGGAGAASARAVDPGARGAGDIVRSRPYFVPLLQQPASPLPAPSLYTKQSGGLTEHHEPASCPVLPVRTARRVPRSCPPSVSGMHAMAFRPSSVPLCVLVPAPPEYSLPEVSDPGSDCARAASLTVAHLLATAVTDPSFESAV